MKRFLKKFFVFMILLWPSYLYSAEITPEQIDKFENLTELEQEYLKSQYQAKKSSGQTPDSFVEHQSVKPRAVETTMGKPGSVYKDTDIWQPGWQGVNLKKYGYDIFSGSPTTFAPVTEIPVPREYIIGPGDQVIIQIYGGDNISYSLFINREGVLNLPNFGPVVASGMSFDEFKSFITNKIKKESVGSEVSVTLGKLRSMRIFVLGEVFKSGSYTLSSLSTLTNALLVSGGVKDIGSLRNIKLKRNGEIIQTFDLYDLLLKGDTKKDTRLLPGDTIFIPVVGSQVGVRGGVKRPGIYELKDETTLGEIINMAGGLWRANDLELIKVYTTDSENKRVCKVVKLDNSNWGNTKIKKNDYIYIPYFQKETQKIITLSGNVFAEGTYEFKKGMNLRTIIPNHEKVKRNTDLEYGIILREKSRFEQFEVISFSPEKIINKTQNVYLKPFDRIYILPKDNSRLTYTNAIVRLLKSRISDSDGVVPTAAIKGNVFYPGQYPLSQGDTVNDYIEKACGLKPFTEFDYYVVSRINKDSGQLFVFNNSLEKDKDFQLEPGDSIYIFSTRVNRANFLKPVVGQILYGMEGGEFEVPEILKVSDDSEVSVSGTEVFEQPEQAEKSLSESAQESIVETPPSVPGETAAEIASSPGTFLGEDSLGEIVSGKGFENSEFPFVTQISGNIAYPGIYPLASEDTLGKLVAYSGGLKIATDFKYIVLVRTYKDNGKIEVFKLDLNNNLNFPIKPLDELYVFSKNTNRPAVLSRVVSKLKSQADNEEASSVVNIGGKVRFPGEYPLTLGLTIKDLIEFAGGFVEGSYEKYCEISRSVIDDFEEFRIKRHKINLSAKGLNGVDAFYLQPRDRIFIKTVPYWREIPSVLITGEVKFPGVYFIEKGDTISTLVEIAGGLTNDAFIDGSVYMREELKQLEKQRYDAYVDQLSAQLSSKKLQGAAVETSQQEDAALLSLIQRIKNATPSGRLVIDLGSVLSKKQNDIRLKDKDHLHIPMYKDEVTVMGEVYTPVSHLYQSGMKVFDFIDSSGGVTASASVKRIYTIRANGRVVPYKSGSKGLFSSKNKDIYPGDTIVVPYDVTAMSGLVFWGEVTKILYNLATTTAALKTVGVY